MSLRHGHESSLRLVSDFHRNLKEQQNVCIAYSLRLRDVKAKLKVKKPVVIQEFLRTAASHGDSWAQLAIQHIQSTGHIPDN